MACRELEFFRATIRSIDEPMDKASIPCPLLEGKSIEELDMGLKYSVFTNFMDQSLILTSYEKLLIL